jgi:hypothetical protein
MLLTGIIPSHVCDCPMPAIEFPKPYVLWFLVFFVLSELKWDVNVRLYVANHYTTDAAVQGSVRNENEEDVMFNFHR